jgi:hypothetical protein
MGRFLKNAKTHRSHPPSFALTLLPILFLKRLFFAPFFGTNFPSTFLRGDEREEIRRSLPLRQLRMADLGDADDLGATEMIDLQDRGEIRVERVQTSPSPSPPCAGKCCGPSCGPLWTRIVRFKRVLGSLPGFVWLLFVFYALYGYVYFGTTFMITTYFTKALGETSQSAADIYGVYGIVSTIWIVFLGIGVDYFKRTSLLLLVGAVASLVGRVFLLLSPQFLPRVFAFVGLLVLASFGDGAMMLALRVIVAEQIKPTRGRRKITYGLLYSGLNVGALLAGVGRDLMTTFYCSSLVAQSILMPSNFVFLLTSIVALIMLGVCGFLFVVLRRRTSTVQHMALEAEDSQSDGSSQEDDEEQDEDDNDNNKSPPTCRENCGVMRTGRFWRFIAFNTLSLGTKSVFRQVDVIVPLVVAYYFGNNSALGTLSNIDPLVIIVLAPVVASATRHLDAVRSMIIGSSMMVMSQWLMAWATPDRLGLWALVLFGVVMATGEAFFGPRLDDYAAEMAGKRHLGFYMMALTPIGFAAKFPAAWLSGWALSQYCPMPANEAQAQITSESAVAAFCNATAFDSNNNTNLTKAQECDVLGLWSLITVMTILVSPFLLGLFEPLLRQPRDASSKRSRGKYD